MKLNVLATALLGSMLTFNSVAAEMSKTEQANIEKIMHQYLVSHPEILIEMSNALRAKKKPNKRTQIKICCSNMRIRSLNKWMIQLLVILRVL